MFTVLFEVQPLGSKWDTYLGIAKGLKPVLEQVPGFVRNVRYRSLQRDGWLLSLSDWEDEKALVRWRTREPHHHAQEKGREDVLVDYHLRVGQVADGSSAPRQDLTEVGEGAFVTLLETRTNADSLNGKGAVYVARTLGLEPSSKDLLAWDLFDAVLTPGDVILMCTWRTEGDAANFESRVKNSNSGGGPVRIVRVIRDYGKYDRREAPQFYPDVTDRETLHA